MVGWRCPGLAVVVGAQHGIGQVDVEEVDEVKGAVKEGLQLKEHRASRGQKGGGREE